MSVARGSERRQAALSRPVSAAAARRLVEAGDPAGVAELIANPEAKIDDEILARALAAFPGDDRLHAAMISRTQLPPEIVLRLGTLVADHRLPLLVRRHAAPGSARRRHAERAIAASG
jgi:hypothetical protein